MIKDINMRLRPYIECRDFDVINKWIVDERTHAMWCANLIQFPIEKDNFNEILNEAAERFGDSPYVVTLEDGTLVGFFCYSANLDTNEGMLKFVMINPDYRGKGYGRDMLKLAIKYAFEITKASNGIKYECAYSTNNMYAGYPHLYFRANINVAKNFVNAMRNYRG